MVAPSTELLLTEWHWEPSIVLGTVLLAGLYSYAVGPLRERRQWGPPASRRQVSMFLLSLLVLVVALLSPLDTVGDQYLFSAHMVQHLLLATLWPPLLIMALPSWLATAIFRAPGGSVLRFFCAAVPAILFFNADIYLWHLPGLYDLTLSNELIHVGEHLSFMVFGLFVWWPVLSPLPEQRLSYPLQVLYLLAAGMLMMVLGIVFTFAPTAFYAPYAAAPRLWGLSAQTDQEIGGLIMWYPGNVPYVVLLIVAFYRWFDEGGPATQGNRTAQSPTMGPPVR